MQFLRVEQSQEVSGGILESLGSKLSFETLQYVRHIPSVIAYSQILDSAITGRAYKGAAMMATLANVLWYESLRGPIHEEAPAVKSF